MVFLLLRRTPSPQKKYRNVINSLRKVIVKCDSAASSHYWRDEDIDVLTQVKPYKGHRVTLPNNTQIAPAKKGLVPISNAFSDQARTATNLPALKSASLLAVAPLCDDGKLLIFDKHKVVAINDTPSLHKEIEQHKILLTGKRNFHDNCWDIEIHNETLNNQAQLPKTHPGLYNNRQPSRKKCLQAHP